MTFTAKYRGHCDACEDPVFPGQEVEFTFDRHLVHAQCPESLDTFGNPRPVCPRCFLEVPVSGVCEECS